MSVKEKLSDYRLSRSLSSDFLSVYPHFFWFDLVLIVLNRQYYELEAYDNTR